VKFVQLLRLLSLGMRIGPPPDVSDETAFRRWVATVLGFLGDLALMTTADADDRLVATITDLAANDRYWSLFYGILKAAIDYVRPIGPDTLLVGHAEIKTLAEEAKFDPATLVVVIQAVLQAIEWFRQWRKDR
jgi:hypothetical protein